VEQLHFSSFNVTYKVTQLRHSLTGTGSQIIRLFFTTPVPKRRLENILTYLVYYQYRHSGSTCSAQYTTIMLMLLLEDLGDRGTSLQLTD